MKELEDGILDLLNKIGAKKVGNNKIIRQPSEMDLMIGLQSNETIIREYLQGFSTEEISLKNDVAFKDIDKIIDCYNYLYN